MAGDARVNLQVSRGVFLGLSEVFGPKSKSGPTDEKGVFKRNGLGTEVYYIVDVILRTKCSFLIWRCIIRLQNQTRKLSLKDENWD